MQIVTQDLSGANAEVSGSMLGGNEEAVDLKFKLRNIEDEWKIDDYSFNANSAMRNYAMISSTRSRKAASIVSWPGSERGRPNSTPDSRAIRSRRQAQREIVHNGENGAIRPALNRYLILRAVAWMRSIQNLSLGV